MADTIKAIARNASNGSVKTYDVAANGTGPVRIQAEKGLRYEFQDPAQKNKGPANLRAKRVGQNLNISFGDPAVTDVVIEDYYKPSVLGDGTNGLYGRGEDGLLYEYIPQSQNASGAINALPEGGVAVSQIMSETALAGAEAFELAALPAAAAIAGMSPLTAVLAAVGVAAVAGGGGGGGGGAATPTGLATPSAPTGYVDNAGGISTAASTAGTTDDTTPGIKIGTLPTDATSAVLYVDGTAVPATYDATTGTLTPTTPLTPGAHSITYAWVDAAGNTSAPSGALAITVDTTAPAATAVALGTGVSGGATAAEATAATGVVKVTGETGSKIVVTFTDSSNPSHTVTKTINSASASGDAVALAGSDLGTGANQLKDGAITVSVVATDAAGNPTSATTGTTSFTLDTSGPVFSSATTATTPVNTPTSTTVYDANATDNGGANDVGITYTLGGTNASLFNISTTGAVTFKSTPTTAASYSFTVTGADAAGNPSTQTVSLTVGAGPTKTIATAALSADTGTSATDFVTSTASQTISGTLSAALGTGETVYGSLNNGVTWILATSTVGQNTWSLAGQTLTASNTLLVEVRDSAGNAGTRYSKAYVLDTTVTAPSLSLATDSGTNTTDGVTNMGTVNVSGLETGAAWQYQVDTGAFVNGTGSSFTATAGSHSYVVKQTDLAGNPSTASTAVTYNLDAVLPTVNSVAITGATGIQGSTLNAGDVVSVTVTMSEITIVTGAPQLALNIGGTTVQASYFSGSGSTKLVFTYTILSNQTDPNGIAIPANALTLNGGALADAAGNGAVITSTAVADNAGFLVDNTTLNVNSVAITSATGIQGNTLNEGDAVSVTVTMSAATTVDTTGGVPTVDMNIGGTIVKASYASGSGTTGLVFTYTIAAGQTDTNGISLAANALTLNGGTLKDAGGNAAVITSTAVTDNGAFLVDTTASNLPTIQLGAGVADNGVNIAEAAAGIIWVTADAGSTITATFTCNGKSFTKVIAKATGAPQLMTLDLVNELSISPNFPSYFDLTASVVATDAAGNSSAPVVTIIDANPAGTVYMTNVAASTGGFVVNGEALGVGSGFSLSNAGDVNGDGLDDFMIGINSRTNTGIPGKSYVVFGQTDTTPIDLASLGAKGFVINGGVANDGVGPGLSNAGDINGDGLADLLVGANGTSKSYVVYGKTGSSTVELTNLGTQGFEMYSGAGMDAGWSVSNAGDVNGDGLTDLIVGAPNFGYRLGKSYVVFGQTGNAPINLNNLGTGGFDINGFTSGENRFGWSVSGAGDVNGDGLADVIMGAYVNGVNSINYVVFGQTGNTAVDITNLGIRGFAIYGDSLSRSYSGYSVTNAGDVNGDGLADILVRSAGTLKTYVVFGQTGNSQVDLTALGSHGFAMQGAGINNYNESCAGDVNGDGLSDLLVSAETVGLYKSFVVYGKTDTTDVNLVNIGKGVGGFRIQGLTPEALSTAGDVNGDGFADFLVGIPTANGQTYVIFGGSNLAGAGTTLVDFVGTASADTQTGTTSSETFMAGDGNDTLIGNGGADVMHGGKGNDTLVVNAANITALASKMGAGGNTDQLALADGGTGFDTLRLVATSGDLDLTKVSNVDGMSSSGTSRISSIERIDLATDTGINPLTLAASDVNDMAGLNLIHTTGASADGKTWTNVGAGTALTDVAQYHQLVVDGGSNDVVSLKTSIGAWANVGQVSDGTSTYNVLQNAGTHSELIVKSGMAMYDLSTVSPATTPASTKLNLLGASMSLDLAAFTAQTSQISQVDISGTGANTLKINLNDVLTGSPTHVLQVTGGGDDTVNLATGVWSKGGTNSANGHTYDIYTGASSTQMYLDTLVHVNMV
jgi:hypothetical protein